MRNKIYKNVGLYFYGFKRAPITFLNKTFGGIASVLNRGLWGVPTINKNSNASYIGEKKLVIPLLSSFPGTSFGLHTKIRGCTRGHCTYIPGSIEKTFTIFFKPISVPFIPSTL